jgi:nicotinamidase-related amidase
LDRDGTCALVIVDMQVNGTSAQLGFDLAMDRLSPGIADAYHHRIDTTVIPAIQHILGYFRGEGLPVFHVVSGSQFPDYRDVPGSTREWLRRLEWESGVSGIMSADEAGFAIRPELTPTPAERVVRKTTFSAFAGTELEPMLSAGGVENLVVVGVTTCVCVESTARSAVDLGFRCVLVDRALADYDDDAHRASLRGFAASLGRVVESAESLIEAIDAGVPV